MTTTRRYSIVCACAPNTPSGNPRRLFVVLDPEFGVVGIFDDDFQGEHAVPAYLRDRASFPLMLDVPVSEHRRLLKKRAAIERGWDTHYLAMLDAPLTGDNPQWAIGDLDTYARTEWHPPHRRAEAIRRLLQHAGRPAHYDDDDVIAHFERECAARGIPLR